jgi:hypothetical protein
LVSSDKAFLQVDGVELEDWTELKTRTRRKK